jgi:hypothetical protein
MFREAYPPMIKGSRNLSHHHLRTMFVCAQRKAYRGSNFTCPVQGNTQQSSTVSSRRKTQKLPTLKTNMSPTTKSGHPPNKSRLPPLPSKIPLRARVCQHNCAQVSHRKGARGIRHQKHPYYINCGARFPVRLFWLPCTPL